MRRRQLPLLAARACEESDPQSRLWKCGPRCLTDAELLALVLRTGRPGATALDVAQEVLGKDGLAALPLLQGNRLLGWAGVGPAKAASVVAASELSCRIARARLRRRLLDKQDLVASYLSQRYQGTDQEIVGALYLDSGYRLIAEEELFRGTVYRVTVELRRFFSRALHHHAPNFVVFHTHPSGDPAPSAEDLDLTQKLVKAGEFLGILLRDHIIVGQGGRFVSLQRRSPW